jgi:hypothetical protein
MWTSGVNRLPALRRSVFTGRSSFNESSEIAFICATIRWHGATRGPHALGQPMSLFRLEDKFRDQRKSPRFEVHYLGQIDLGAHEAPVNCIICDISATGAKLTVGAHEVPDEFVLVLRRRCRVTRRSDGQVAVKFVQS